MSMLNLPFLGDDPRRLAWRAAQVVIIVLLAVQTARLIWLVVTPAHVTSGVSAAAAPDRLPILTRFDPFFRAAPQALAAATSQAFRLHGVRASGGGAGSAIIGTPDGRQASFAVGDELAPGVRLVSVEADHVVIARGGVRSPLHFPADPGALESMVQP